jgi:DNA polymerase-3 subunit alpha
MNKFIHLHTHSNFTEGNSTLKLEDLVIKTKEYGMSSTALCDSGTIDGFSSFSKMCEKSDIKPIFGCGFYHAVGSRKDPKGRNHLVLIAYDQTGMENLKKMCEIAKKEGYHNGKAHIDDELLKKYNEGLICLTGGLGGEIDKAIIAGDIDKAIKRVLFFADLYPGNFYLELQNHGSEKNKIAMNGLIELSKKLQFPVVCSQGAFYLNKEDAQKCNELRTLNGKKELYGSEYYYKSADEMIELFKDHPQAISNTLKIAEQCEHIDQSLL